MSSIKKFFFVFIFLTFLLVGILQQGLCQSLWTPYPFFMPWVQSPFIPAYPPLNNLLIPQLPPPAPIITPPYQRLPNATIIISTGITAVAPAPGVLVVGAPTVVSPTTTTTIVNTVPTVINAAPAPLFSLLAIIYTSALYAPALLSTANPLLFGYLSSLVI